MSKKPDGGPAFPIPGSGGDMIVSIYIDAEAVDKIVLQSLRNTLHSIKHPVNPRIPKDADADQIAAACETLINYYKPVNPFDWGNLDPVTLEALCPAKFDVGDRVKGSNGIGVVIGVNPTTYPRRYMVRYESTTTLCEEVNESIELIAELEK
jgi:hypothetical protein